MLVVPECSMFLVVSTDKEERNLMIKGKSSLLLFDRGFSGVLSLFIQPAYKCLDLCTDWIIKFCLFTSRTVRIHRKLISLIRILSSAFCHIHFNPVH